MDAHANASPSAPGPTAAVATGAGATASDKTLSVVHNDNPSGIAFMLLSVTAFSGMDVIGKWVAQDCSVFLMLAVRSLVGTSILLTLLPFAGGLEVLRSRQPWRHVLRCLLGLGAFTFFFAGLRTVPLANGILIFFGSPFLQTALSVPLLGERVSRRQWLAVSLGFLGVVFIVGPEAAGVRLEALYVVAASLCYVLSVLLTRMMTRGQHGEEKSFAFVFYMLGGQALAGVVSLPFSWQPLPPGTLGLLATMGVLGLVGNFGLTLAFRRAEVAIIAPFEYVALLWATLFGLVVFNEFPHPTVWLGATLIVAAGLYSAYLAKA